MTQCGVVGGETPPARPHEPLHGSEGEGKAAAAQVARRSTLWRVAFAPPSLRGSSVQPSVASPGHYIW